MNKNTQKITKALCIQKELVFFPKTHEEAELIQRRLFAMDVFWGNQNIRGINGLERCCSLGMLVLGGDLYVYSHNRKDVYQCTVDQLPLTDHELLKELTEKFNKLSAQVKELQDELQERRIHKISVNKKPGAQEQ